MQVRLRLLHQKNGQVLVAGGTQLGEHGGDEEQVGVTEAEVGDIHRPGRVAFRVLRVGDRRP